MSERLQCPLLRDTDYQPDLLNLYIDSKAAEYWFPCFRELCQKFAKQAEESQRDEDETAKERSEQFLVGYLEELADKERRISEPNPKKNTNSILSVRELLELFDKHLRRFGFSDPWYQQKSIENENAIALFKERLQEIDNMANDDERWTELVRGVLAGNMFDWGAQAVTTILENDENFGLHAALEQIEPRPWLIDNLETWLERLRQKIVHKCAAIFVDNSGVDIVLGILPFARELLRRGTKVLLCANTEPSLNDVTSTELIEILEKCSMLCVDLADARDNQQLLVYGSGQCGPCLDMRSLPRDLCDAINDNETDLLVIEGMGRAVHTNLYAKFSCETLKLAVIKNKWLAQRLGGDTFSVICKYELPPSFITVSDSKKRTPS